MKFRNLILTGLVCCTVLIASNSATASRLESRQARSTNKAYSTAILDQNRFMEVHHEFADICKVRNGVKRERLRKEAVARISNMIFETGAESKKKPISAKSAGLAHVAKARSFSNWTGVVHDVSANNGKVTAVFFAVVDNVRVYFEDDQIDPAGTLGSELSTIKKGSKVTFTGKFREDAKMEVEPPKSEGRKYYGLFKPYKAIFAEVSTK